MKILERLTISGEITPQISQIFEMIQESFVRFPELEALIKAATQYRELSIRFISQNTASAMTWSESGAPFIEMDNRIMPVETFYSVINLLSMLAHPYFQQTIRTRILQSFNRHDYATTKIFAEFHAMDQYLQLMNKLLRDEVIRKTLAIPEQTIVDFQKLYSRMTLEQLWDMYDTIQPGDRITTYESYCREFDSIKQVVDPMGLSEQTAKKAIQAKPENALQIKILLGSRFHKKN